MGMHIVVTIGRKKHPDWDSLRHSADRGFAGIDFDVTIHPEDKETLKNDPCIDYRVRPKNIEELRNKIKVTDFSENESDDYKGRYLKLCDMFEANNDCWLYFSY